MKPLSLVSACASRSSEASLGRHGEGWEWQASAYQTRVRDLIAYDAALQMANNLESARIRGLELTGRLQAGDWQLRGQIGLLQARNLAALPGGGDADLPRRPARSARLELDRLVAVHAGRIGKRVKSLTLRDTRSRWGSCSVDGALSFSWRIAMAPPHVIDYLAAHEVAHLAEMNHSPAFWSLCAQLCPTTEEAKRWLKRNGSLLHAVDFG